MWIEEDNKLKATFTFVDFNEAFSFMTSVAIASEKANHHPFWSNVYNRVNIELCTHDAGNIITSKDKQLAEKIDSIYLKYK